MRPAGSLSNRTPHQHWGLYDLASCCVCPAEQKNSRFSHEWHHVTRPLQSGTTLTGRLYWEYVSETVFAHLLHRLETVLTVFPLNSLLYLSLISSYYFIKLKEQQYFSHGTIDFFTAEQMSVILRKESLAAWIIWFGHNETFLTWFHFCSCHV